MTNEEYIEKMTLVNEVTVYELVDTESGKRYIGQTRKDLQSTRKPQHFAEARTGRCGVRDLHVHLRKVIEEGREDAIEIRPINFPSEHRAIEVIGMDNLLNAHPGCKGDPDGMYTWLPEELKVIEEHAQDEATRILREEHDRDSTNLKNKVRDTRAQLCLADNRALSDDEALEAYVLYHASDLSLKDVAKRFETHASTIGQIVRGETYTDIDFPSKAAIEAADAYNRAEAAFRRSEGQEVV